MPWKIESRGGKFVVMNKETGAVKGTHPTREAASAQLRALYANVDENFDDAVRKAKKHA